MTPEGASIHDPSTATGPFARVFPWDPTAPLVRSDDPAIRHWARRELRAERVGPVSGLWSGAPVTRLLRRQREDGSWAYRGAPAHLLSRCDYDQLETYRAVGELVEKYGMTRRHESLHRAGEFLLGLQTPEGDIRGIYGSQYSPNYTAAILELVVKAGFGADPRVRRAFDWLSGIRQDDGGWAIPLRTRGRRILDVAGPTLEPDPTAPFSHLVTGIVLRAYAADPRRRRGAIARHGAGLLAGRIFERDRYPDRAAAGYWTRFSFPFWQTDLISALDTLSRIGRTADHPRIARALDWLAARQRPDGSFELQMLRGRDQHLPQWLALAICRVVLRGQSLQ